MELIMLGTGSAHAVTRYNTCFILRNGAKLLLTDGGGGNRIFDMLRKAEIDLDAIHDLFITHAHTDHIFGAIWVIRVIGQHINSGSYAGDLRVYCHQELIDAVQTIARLTIDERVLKLFGSRIQLIAVAHGERKDIAGMQVTFFDIGSEKKKQFGFTAILPDGQKLTCCGDEPYRPESERFAAGSDWLLTEAFCLYAEADIFQPYEKGHSTVREACMTAQTLNAPNLVLYHTEESHGTERRELYLREGQQFYHGKLYVPEDLEIIPLD